MVRRGVDFNKLLTPKLFLHDLDMDFETSIKFIKKIYDDPQLYAIGVSMGSNRLAKYVGKTQKKCPFKAMAGMACPFRPTITAITTILPGNEFYNQAMVENMSKIVLRNYDLLKMQE